jgi:hypothetical protein
MWNWREVFSSGWGQGPFEAFQAFSGLGVKTARAALDPLKLETLEVAPGRQHLVPPEDRAAFEKFKASKEPRYSLLGSIDSLFLLCDLQTDADSAVTKMVKLLPDLPSHAIVDRGRLVGLWEYDPATESIAWMPFIKKDKALAEAVTRTENFVREQLGDARSFSLDSPKSRAPRVAALRRAAASA